METEEKTLANLAQRFYNSQRYMVNYVIRDGRSYIEAYDLKGLSSITILVPIKLSEAARASGNYASEVDFSAVWYWACDFDPARPIKFTVHARQIFYFDSHEISYDLSASSYAAFKQYMIGLNAFARNLDKTVKEEIDERARH